MSSISAVGTSLRIRRPGTRARRKDKPAAQNRMMPALAGRRGADQDAA
jgi:hypothetical protein